MEKQKAEASYRRKHKAGQTEEAQRDLARLAIIRQQRAETQKKKEAEKKGERGQVNAGCCRFTVFSLHSQRSDGSCIKEEEIV